MSRKPLMVKDDLPTRARDLEARQMNEARLRAEKTKAQMSSLTFEELSGEQKDELLKALAVNFGFLKPSPERS